MTVDTRAGGDYGRIGFSVDHGGLVAESHLVEDELVPESHRSWHQVMPPHSG